MSEIFEFFFCFYCNFTQQHLNQNRHSYDSAPPIGQNTNSLLPEIGLGVEELFTAILTS